MVANLSSPMVKVHKAMPNAPGMEQSEIDIFLTSSKIPLRLGTVDSKGDPMIHPVWFHYSNGKLYLMSIKENKKVRNINCEENSLLLSRHRRRAAQGRQGQRHGCHSHRSWKVGTDNGEDSRQVSWRS